MNKILIIHYNTPSLTECLVRSINMQLKDPVHIYIFDNSDKLPFVAKFNNVTVFDNTKGQIINFDKWLENYKNKGKSPGRVNNWGSAKHCYSVEKCMELINDNFVLLDSDILLKRDISNLFIDNAIYVGETIVQPLSTINRVLPFVCFINVKMCKEHNVHYFDDNYMHGLCKTFAADKYDTGAGFYINSKNLKHVDIKCDEYVVHYGHGSWNKNGCKPKYDKKEWLEINKKYWSVMKNKKVIYTCITGDYDSLLEPTKITEGFDYICFTDNLNMKSDIWEIRPLPKETEGLSQVKKQRYVKINAHKVLSEYDISVWVDGNITVKGDLNKLIDSYLKEDVSVYVPKHPRRDCIYSEATAVIGMRKDTRENVEAQIERYKKNGFPKNYGLLQSNILLRKHNSEDCIKLMEYWFNELKNGSHRDQLSFNYALWKNGDVKVVYMDRFIYKSEWFFWNTSHKRKKDTKKVLPNQNSKKSLPKENQNIKALKASFYENFKKIRYSKKNRNKLQTYKIGIYSV